MRRWHPYICGTYRMRIICFSIFNKKRPRFFAFDNCKSFFWNMVLLFFVSLISTVVLQHLVGIFKVIPFIFVRIMKISRHSLQPPFIEKLVRLIKSQRRNWIFFQKKKKMVSHKKWTKAWFIIIYIKIDHVLIRDQFLSPT